MKHKSFSGKIYFSQNENNFRENFIFMKQNDYHAEYLDYISPNAQSEKHGFIPDEVLC